MTTLIIPNIEMDDVVKVFKSREESSFLIGVISKTIKKEAKKPKKMHFLACYKVH